MNYYYSKAVKTSYFIIVVTKHNLIYLNIKNRNTHDLLRKHQGQAHPSRTDILT